MAGMRIRLLEGDDPERLGAYRLLGRLGVGGMGRIYLARSTVDGSLVAVKTLLAEGEVSAVDRRRFTREVALARRIDSDRTARVLAAAPEAERPWMAIEFIAAPSLAELVRDAGPLKNRAVRWIAAGVAEALVLLHREDVFHRDLKPQNIMLPATGPRVIDFGISHARDVTQTTLTLGTIAFVSPEQARGENSTAKSDVYSLGATLFYLAVGRPPYQENVETLRLLTLVQQGEVDLTGLPRRLAPLIRPCLALDPEHRPEPGELLRQSASLLEGTASSRQAAHWLPPEWVTLIDTYAEQGRTLREEGGAEAVTVVRETPPPPPGTGPTREYTDVLPPEARGQDGPTVPRGDAGQRAATGGAGATGETGTTADTGATGDTGTPGDAGERARAERERRGDGERRDAPEGNGNQGAGGPRPGRRRGEQQWAGSSFGGRAGSGQFRNADDVDRGNAQARARQLREERQERRRLEREQLEREQRERAEREREARRGTSADSGPGTGSSGSPRSTGPTGPSGRSGGSSSGSGSRSGQGSGSGSGQGSGSSRGASGNSSARAGSSGRSSSRGGTSNGGTSGRGRANAGASGRGDTNGDAAGGGSSRGTGGRGGSSGSSSRSATRRGAGSSGSSRGSSSSSGGSPSSSRTPATPSRPSTGGSGGGGAGVALVVLLAIAVILWQPWNQDSAGSEAGDSGGTSSSTSTSGSGTASSSGTSAGMSTGGSSDGGGSTGGTSSSGSTGGSTGDAADTDRDTPEPPRPDATTRAFQRVSVGDCLPVYDTGRGGNSFDWSASRPPPSVPCSSGRAIVRVSGTGSSSCPSGTGKGSWSHYSSSTRETIRLCLTRVFHERYCVLATQSGDSITLGSMTSVDCRRSRVPKPYNQIMHITGVYRAPAGADASNCRRAQGDQTRYWSWTVNDGQTLLCTTVFRG
ncbi:serine/threonine-protein kinase [Streptomyces sp. AJS327]|uniref:serine/threonine-protein kinase n=1 Tax=Streptomyces sp. AJS327 TaxID=2545265 RepID=UPI0015DFDA2C|nr:serine/threonine-protein kinase [Streptomyces sp. AJS327]